MHARVAKIAKADSPHAPTAVRVAELDVIKTSLIHSTAQNS